MTSLSLFHFFYKNPLKKSLSLLDGWIQRGKPIRDFLQLDTIYEKTLYNKAYNFFINNDLNNAERLFGFLTLLNCHQKEYWKALGSCQFGLMKYHEAIANFTTALIIDTQDFDSIINIALSYEKLKEKEKVLNTLQWAKKLHLDKEQSKHIFQIERSFRG